MKLLSPRVDQTAAYRTVNQQPAIITRIRPALRPATVDRRRPPPLRIRYPRSELKMSFLRKTNLSSSTCLRPHRTTRRTTTVSMRNAMRTAGRPKKSINSPKAPNSPHCSALRSRRRARKRRNPKSPARSRSIRHPAHLTQRSATIN